MSWKAYSKNFDPAAPVVECEVKGPLSDGTLAVHQFEAMLDTGCDFALLVGDDFAPFAIEYENVPLKGICCTAEGHVFVGLSISVEGEPIEPELEVIHCPGLSIPLLGRPILNEFLTLLDGESERFLLARL